MTDTALAVSMRPEGRDAVLDPLAEVLLRNDLNDLAAKLLELRDWLSDDLTELEEGISAFDTGHTELAWQAAIHLLRRPGKRIRPLCVILSARLGGMRMNESVRDLAIACELVHAATLLHDDVIDEGEERRGAPAARLLYSNCASVLGGDHLLVEALRLVDRTQRRLFTAVGLLPSLLDAISAMVTAEALQLERRGRFEPNRESYLDIIRGKTAVLFQWGLQSGGTVASLPPEQLEALSRAGLALGTAFQLVDDVLDLEGDPAVTGKGALVDLREGKLTWPFILASERDSGFAEAVRDAVDRPDGPSPLAAARIVERVRQCGAVEDTRALAARQGAKARAEFGLLPPGKARESLEMLVDATIARSR